MIIISFGSPGTDIPLLCTTAGPAVEGRLKTALGGSPACGGSPWHAELHPVRDVLFTPRQPGLRRFPVAHGSLSPFCNRSQSWDGTGEGGGEGDKYGLSSLPPIVII